MARRQNRDKSAGVTNTTTTTTDNPIDMIPRMRTAGGYGSKKDRSMQCRIGSSSKAFSSAITDDSYVMGTASQNRTQRGMKQSRVIGAGIMP